ncbi:MAG: hypothetical protein KDC65_04450 [Saprospiraceae bacterium]|nr:hypothetical protein [Saprospiraceae bacterium]
MNKSLRSAAIAALLLFSLHVSAQNKAEVWDFAAEQLDTSLYDNQLTETIINSWYAPNIPVGSSGNVLPTSFTAGILSWTGGGNDRLRTTNTNLTRYDENISTAPGHTGRIYVNSAANVSRFMSLMLEEDDEITIATKTDAGGIINFEYVADPNGQTDQVPITSDFTELHFVAKEAGEYHIFDTQGKPSYYRVARKNATYLALTGTVDESLAAGIPADYAIVFTNDAGKSWSTNVSNGQYTVTLPTGYTYQLSLSGASGYIIVSGETLDLTGATTTHDIAIAGVQLYTVSGAVIGLGTEISSLSLQYTPDPQANAVYVPAPVVDAGAGTYSVSLESGIEYTITAEGVNDFYLPANTITIGSANTSADVEFSPKPVFNVSTSVEGLTQDQANALSLTFDNLYEAGYSYNFSSLSGVQLRSGTYTVSQSGLDAYPVELALTSNLTVADADTAKTLRFVPVTNWNFDDQVINNGDPAYKGMLFTGQVANEIAKSHLTAKNGATIQVPVNPGETVRVTYYYTADFSFEGGTAITTNSQSTSLLEYAEYTYPDAIAGYVTINVGASASTSYFPNISTIKRIPYKATITVGTDKEYQTINEALDAIRRMIRNDDDRVTVLIDPGDYEEMLVIDEPNVTLKNAAPAPNTDLLNNGVDIADGAVRVTSYYGYGYSYFSMGNDQKWNADVLAVNKENGYLSYENQSGTTNGSYWNATVVVSAEGFVADYIIFENSYNQYTSKKESEDTVVEWAVGGKGPRPVDYGNTEVQDKSFVERAAAIAFPNNTDKAILNKCRVVGRQDAFFGGSNARVVVYKGSVMGAVDYIYGGMTAVFYKTELAMNTSDAGNDQAYITAAQQSSGRGYLMYECTVTSAKPGLETASVYRSKPGYFGRPWLANTSEVVFYNTTIETSDYPGSEGLSLIVPSGWQNTLGGESSMMYEYGTTEVSGVDNSTARASWATFLDQPQLSDGTDITTFNFTKGSDGWDPLPGLISADQVGASVPAPVSAVNVHAYGHRIYISNVTSDTKVEVYDVYGKLVRSLSTTASIAFDMEKAGAWFIHVRAADGQKTAKVITQ